ncbi:unnamed protein product [Cyprideis torosa]|uniref:Uncharacterized protein n=1 Tax=Cyprideis torosa TaxID=163714 RepID=A0A7R8WF79_9CRUS|nr:unnamed protein product [Cyprideis torosa]CAG0896511.1 unnamed protein product [Cyprideis torosa]
MALPTAGELFDIDEVEVDKCKFQEFTPAQICEILRARLKFPDWIAVQLRDVHYLDGQGAVALTRHVNEEELKAVLPQATLQAKLKCLVSSVISKSETVILSSPAQASTKKDDDAAFTSIKSDPEEAGVSVAGIRRNSEGQADRSA